MLTDQHLHSLYSCDGEQALMDACARYAQLGFQHICFTEHVDLGHPDPFCAQLPDFPRWQAEITQARERFPDMFIGMGIEMGDLAPTREATAALLAPLPLDFRLLSLHVVLGKDCYDPACYEGHTREELYTAYAEALADTVAAWTDYDAVSHIGYCAKFAPYPMEVRPFTWADAPDALDAALKTIIQQGKCLEINTSGYKKMGEAIPHPSILKRYVELGGSCCTFGTDSHDLTRDGDHIREAMELAQTVGIRYGVVFRQRKPNYWKLG